MGCDIHAYVEYRTKTKDGEKEKTYWTSLGRIYMSRYYHFFGLLGNHRRGHQGLFEPKGLPENLGAVARDEWWLPIVSDEEAKSLESAVTLENATHWNENYGCKIEYFNDEPYKVENPDWHTETWITTAELKEALKNVDQEEAYIDGEVVLAMMESVEKNGQEARLIVWFDN